MKTHTFKAIRWLGEPFDQQRFAVVEVDQNGPVLRRGPLSERRAEDVAKNLHRSTRYRGFQRGTKGGENGGA